MSSLPPLFLDLAIILITAGVITVVFKWLKQPLVLGYIVAGFVVSPHMPYTMSVIDTENIHSWANELAIMMLTGSERWRIDED